MFNILCYGDSNTYGHVPETGGRYPRSVRWPGVLQELLGPEYYVIEEGLCGRTTMFDDPDDPCRNGLEYLEASLLSHQPLDLVILFLGSNDTKYSFNASAELITEGLSRLCGVIRGMEWKADFREPRILIVAPPAIGAHAGSFFPDFDESSVKKAEQLAPLYKKTADEYGALFIDASLCAHAGADDLHLDRESHRRLAEELKKIILPLNGFTLPEL